MARDIIFGAQYTESKLGKTGLTVTFNVYRVTLADLAINQIVTGGSGTAVGQGLYIYKVSSADLQTYYYFAVAATSTTTVDQREIPAVQLDWMDRSAGVTASTVSDKTGYALTSGERTSIRTEMEGATTYLTQTKDRVLLALPEAETGDFGGIADFNTQSTQLTNISTLINRLGAFTGSGVNTVLGFFRALMRSDATLPSDVAGTYDPTTDSNQGQTDAALTAAGVRSAVGLASANLDTQLDALPTAAEIAAAVPTVAQIADGVWDEATSGHQTAGTTGEALTDAAAGGGGGSTYAVMGMYVKIGETDDTFISAGVGDTVEVALFFRDASNQAVVIPTVDTNVMLDSGNSEVGTVTLTDYKLEVGWLYYTLEIPASGNMPTRLRVQFSTGSGASHRRDVNIKVTS